MNQIRVDNKLAEPMRAAPFFNDSFSGFPNAVHMRDSWMWLEGKGQSSELSFTCRTRAVSYLRLLTSYLLSKQIDVIKVRSVFSMLGWSAEPPQDLGELVGLLVAGGPLLKVPEAVGAGGSSHA